VKKILILTNILSPYRVPLFNRLHKEDEVEVYVCALNDEEENRNWGNSDNDVRFDYEILGGLHKYIWNYEYPLHLNYGLLRVLRNEKPDVILTSGYEQPAYWLAALYSKIRNKRFVTYMGTHKGSTGVDGYLKTFAKRKYLEWVDAVVSHGTKTSSYLKKLSVEENKIHEGFNTVDMKKFRNETIQNKNYKQVGGSEKVEYIFIGQFIKRKGIFELIREWPTRDRSISLKMVGSGPMFNRVKNYVNERGIDNIKFEGNVKRKEIYKFYRSADILVMPSLKEVWGLVVNEALASGLFVISSIRAGCTTDIIREGFNGITFDPEKKNDLHDKIKKANKNINEIREKREDISKHAVRNMGLDRHISAFMSAIKA